MKTTRYRFEQAVQEVKEDTTQWLIEELRSILESDKDFTRKCDYIGFSIANMDAKVASIDEEIKELQALKKSLKSAKELTLTIGAKVFGEYGIARIEGAGISSITVSQPVTKMKSTLLITDEEELIKAGYYKISIDEEAVASAFENSEEKKLVQKYAQLSVEEVTTLSKLKVNKRRDSANKSVPFPLKDMELVS